MAVDVTLVGPEGREADMGSGFDEMTPRSHPALHEEHLASGVLTRAQVQSAAGCPTRWPTAASTASPTNGGTSITATATPCGTNCRGV